MENQEMKQSMRNYLGVVVFPDKYLERVTQNTQTPVLLLVWLLIVLGVMLPQGLLKSQASPLGEVFWGVWLVVSMLTYYPVVYGFAYLLWIVGKGFGGQARFAEIRNTVLFSMIPSVVHLPFTIIYVWIAVSRNDLSIAARENPLIEWLIALVGFRILVTGIARFNKFDKTMTLVNWFLAFAVLSALAGLILLMRN
jgi:hypothetical protein